MFDPVLVAASGRPWTTFFYDFYEKTLHVKLLRRERMYTIILITTIFNIARFLNLGKLKFRVIES